MNIHRYTSLVFFSIASLSISFCYGKEPESQGQPLVQKYLESTDPTVREDILITLKESAIDVDTVKEWVKQSANYKPQKTGLYRKLAEVGRKKGEYFVYIPPSYTPDHAWPVVLALHGVGGNGYEQVMTWLRFSKQYDGCIFVAPTYGSGLWWREEPERFVMSVLETVKRDYYVDTNRVYLTGFSSGGHGVWYLAIRYPWLFSAINPVAGECPLPELLVNLQHIPTYIVHGTEDTIIPVTAARDAYSRLKNLGYPVILKEIPELRHRFPVDEAKDILDWLLTMKRNVYPKKITYSTESTNYPLCYWVEVMKFSGLIGQVYGIQKDIFGQLVTPDKTPVTATVKADVEEKSNSIYLDTQGVMELRLYLEERLIDMERPLHIFINGQEVYSGEVEENIQTVLETTRKRNDRNAIFSATLELKVPDRK